MDLDIGRILKDWPYQPGEVNVRTIVGNDGKEKIQLRLDLGILQMETSGRPDGERPHGRESLLEYYHDLLDQHIERFDSDEGFQLDEEACELLRSEAVMYYHRYLACFVLGDYPSVQRDTRRNLQLFDFCAEYAADETDQIILEQYRPYVLMMYTRARSRIALKNNRPRQALAVVKRGIRDIRDFYEHFEQEEQVESSNELAVLYAMAGEIEPLIPADPRERLHKELRKAIDEERYEDAARIRDRLRDR